MPPARVNGNRGQEVQQVSQEPFGQPTLVPNLGAIREVVADLFTTRTFTCPLLVEKAPDLWKKTQIVGTQV